MSTVKTNASRLQEIRRLIASAKRWDLFFVVIGILSLMIGVLTFSVLFADMANHGFSRLDWDFFTSFPSRRAANAGFFLLGWARCW
jgi:phosphate transport system permease protein